MYEITRCVNCLLPSTKPDLHFDEKGVCGACQYQKFYNPIDVPKGVTFLSLIIMFFGSLSLLGIGLLGEYIGKILY